MKTMNDTLGIPVMNNQLKKKFLAMAIATVGVMPVLAYAQTHAGHAGHTAAPPVTSTPATASGMDHGSMNMSDKDHGSMGMPGMDHGDMQMQGGSPPPDARDPDAYSDGYVRNAGKYALPPSDALIMSDMHNFGSVNFDRLEYVRARGEEWVPMKARPGTAVPTTAP